MDYKESRAYVDSFSHSGTPVQNLDRIRGLLNRIGKPQEKLQYIHIAGTNGKGSVTEYTASMLCENGYRVGTLTSPYIRHYRDRIRINFEDISKESFTELVNFLFDKIGASSRSKAWYSQFEITLAIALLYFAKERVDVVVLESGIGGLLDATNVIASPLVSVITSVSYDHMQILGNTIAEIATQKAGIIKRDCPVVCSNDSHKEAYPVFEKSARLQHAPYIRPQRELQILQCDLHGSHFIYGGYSYYLTMGGEQQIQNALTAIEVMYTLKKQGYTLAEKDMSVAIQRVRVPARIQILRENPLVILDGGHNADGVQKLVNTIQSLEKIPTIGICGMTRTKDISSAVVGFATILDEVLCVDGFIDTALEKQRLAKEFADRGITAREIAISDSLNTALTWARECGGRVLICGSLYLAKIFLTMD